MHDSITDWLQVNRFDPELPLATNRNGEYALILAARQNRTDILKTLLAAGADLGVTDDYGNNALWAACFAEAQDCIDLLLTAGIDIDFQNPGGATALIYTASSGKTAVVEQLLRAGANHRLTTQDDFSAFDLAANRQCLLLLRKAGAGY